MSVTIQIASYGYAIWLHSRSKAYLYKVCASLVDAEQCVSDLVRITGGK